MESAAVVVIIEALVVRDYSGQQVGSHRQARERSKQPAVTQVTLLDVTSVGTLIEQHGFANEFLPFKNTLKQSHKQFLIPLF